MLNCSIVIWIVKQQISYVIYVCFCIQMFLQSYCSLIVISHACLKLNDIFQQLFIPTQMDAQLQLRTGLL